MEAWQALQDLGLALPTPAYLFGMLLFSLLGLVAYHRGHRRRIRRLRWLGLALMFYPYLVGSTWVLYAAGAALCAAVVLAQD